MITREDNFSFFSDDLRPFFLLLYSFRLNYIFLSMAAGRGLLPRFGRPKTGAIGTPFCLFSFECRTTDCESLFLFGYNCVSMYKKLFWWLYGGKYKLRYSHKPFSLLCIMYVGGGVLITYIVPLLGVPHWSKMAHS